jgi:hypothetical protein
MSPRFAPDLAKTKAGMRVFERGDYELKVSGLKPIAYTRESDGKEIAGCQINLQVCGLVLNDGSLDKTDEGESVAPIRLYVHTEDAWPISKRFAMACLGYSLEQEDEFDDSHAETLDLSVDGEGDDAVLGEGWKRLEGKRFLCTLSKRKYEGREQQDHGGFLPITV